MAKKSLKICDLGRTPICDLADNTPYSVRNVVEEFSINEISSLSFDLPVVPNGKWLKLKNEMLVLFNNEYYKIKSITFKHDDDGKLYVSVECKHYSDNLAMDLISISEQTPLNVISLMKVALCYDENDQPTLGWKVGKVTVDRVAVRGLEALEQSPFSILLTIAEKFDGILKFNSQTMTVDMLERQSTSRPILDLRVSKNLKNFSIKYDTSEMYTRLYCYGATDEDGITLDITSVNPTGKGYIDNFDYFKTIGYSDKFIKEHPELFVSTNIWKDDNYYDPTDLYNDGIKELAKIAVPIVDVDISALDTKAIGLSGEITKLDLGACVRIYDEDLGVDTLCNVTKRKIDYEKPYILDATVTNSITYHDTLSKLFTDVNTVSNVVTSGGSIVGGSGGGGVSMDEVKQYLNVYYLNAEQIEAKYASIDELQANYATIEYLKAHYIDAESIAAGYATIGQLHAIEAKIENLDVDYINGKLAEFEQLYADMGEFKDLVANSAEINEIKAGELTVYGTLKATNAEVENLKATSITTGEFEAYKATIEQLFALYASIEYLEANYLKAKQIEATYAKITSLDAVSATIDNLKAKVANVETLVAEKASIEDLNAVKADIENINAKLINVDKILADVITTDELNAEVAKINELIANEIKAVNATITSLDAKFATIEQLNTEIANVNKLIAEKATIEDLNAAKAQIGELDAQLANIDAILSGSIGTGTLQTIHLTAKNVVIDDAVISDLIAAKISVDQLKAGIISTNKFQVQSDDGGFKVVGNTTQWTDSNGKVRMQAGRDADGNFNFAVFGADGTTRYFDENGIHEAGIPDGIIRDDMVADDANIQASKIQYVDKDGNKTLQTILDIQQGKIDALIKETTIDGDSLKDKFTQLEATVNGLNVTVGSVQTSVNEITGDISAMESKITEIETTANGVKTTVTSNQSKWDSAATNATNAINKVTDLEERANSGEFDGKGVQSTTVTYQTSTNGTTAPTGNWTSTIPTVPSGQYLWTRTVITYTDNTTTTMYSVSRNPEDGDKGDKGDKGDTGTSVTVSSTSVTYQISTSGTTSPSGSWQTTIPSIPKGQYLWTKTEVRYSDGKSTVAYSVSRNPNDGSNGTSVTVSSTETTYQVSTSGTSAPTGTWSTSIPSVPAGQYLWTRTIVKYSDGKSITSYSVSRQGVNGQDGNDGKGISSVVYHYLASSSVSGVTTSTSGWTTTPQTVTSTKKYLWSYQTINYTTGSPTNTTPAIIGVYGDKGSTGDTGKGIKSVTPQYYLSTSNTTQTGGSWSSTQPAWSDGKYYWTRDSITWSDNSVTTTTPTLATGLNNANQSASQAKTIAQQTAEKFSWIVKSGTSSTNFELTDRTATLVANQINLKGLVTFEGLNSVVKDKINNAESTANKAKDIIDNWAKDAIVEGTTTINGGYIKTQTITTNQLAVEDIFATGSAVMNIINAQQINADRITSGTIDAKFLSVYGLRVLQQSTDLETLSITEQGDITMRGSVESYNYVAGKTGWSIRNDGDAEFNDVTVRGSVITNDGGIVSSGGSGRNLLYDTAFSSGKVNSSYYGQRGNIYTYSVDTNAFNGSINAMKVVSSAAGSSGADLTMNLTIGNNKLSTTYTFSGWIKGDKVNSMTVRFGYGNGSSTVDITTEWRYFSVQVLSGDTQTYHLLLPYINSAGTVYLAQIKLEEGSVATPWSPAPEDNLKQVRFWAGTSYEERENAPFKVYSDGSVEATQGTYSGVWTGDIRVGNISIVDPSQTSGGDAVLTIRNGQNGINNVELTDTDHSTFRQSVHISDNANNTIISLNQNGSIIANNSLTVGTTRKVIIDDDSININGSTLSNTGTKLSISAPAIDIGSSSSTTPIGINGNASVMGILRVVGEISFNDVIICKTSSNGIDFNFNE